MPRGARMAADSEKHAARNAILLLLAVFLVAGYAIAFGPQTLVWLNTKRWASTNPWLRDVPQPLPAPTVQPASPAAAAAKNMQVKAFNYEFNAPWPIATITPAPNVVHVRFKPGQAIVFFDPDAQLDTLRVIKNSNPLEYQRFSNLFSDHPIETNYELYENVYAASPAQLSPFTPVRTALRVNTLLEWKLSFGTEGSPAHSFAFGDLRGFQFGDPDSGKPVAVRVFNDRDRQFRFLFNSSPGPTSNVTQNDIEMTVASLQPVPILER
jgi:hypothetical protein